ncbi:MAG TPA: SbcC/MukB-like Walker B domain-containing protein [Chthoniobacterales bacterium]
MNQRISLTRIIALNWYGFRQIFDVNDNVLISGAFGTGKSVLLDLLQYVLLGKHWRANRAAAGTGTTRGRDLVGYCLADTNQTRNGQRHFLRSSGVTLVALEFTRPKERGKEPQRETWGIRLEFSSPDAEPSHTYFFVPDRLDYSEVAPGGKMLANEDFRRWLRREYGHDTIFSRQEDYLAEMAQQRHLNFDPAAFHRTFPKAIAFEPEENVEKFIRDFILEENPLDVKDVRIALRAYDDTRRRLEKQEDEAAFLRRICEQHEIFENSRREEAVLEHLGRALRLRRAVERRDELAAKIQRLEDEHADDSRKFDEATDELRRVEETLREVRFEIGRDPSAAKIAELDGKKRSLQEEVSELREAQKSARERLDDRHSKWLHWLKHGRSLQLDEALNVDDALLAFLRSGRDAERLAVLPKLAERFQEIWNAVRDLARPIEEEVKGILGSLLQIAKDLDSLEKGRAPGAFPLFQAVRQKLGDRVEQLGRLIEVRPDAERWWPALELFLGRNRWVLVTSDGRDYREALEILRRIPPGREAESLLNPGEVRQLRASPVEGSLFGKVEVAHPVARQYVEHLLGDVLCLETIEDMEASAAGRAITPEGAFKQIPLRRRLKSADGVELTLGHEGLQRMRAAKEKKQIELRSRQNVLDQRLNDIKAWLDLGKRSGLSDATLPDRATELPNLPKLESELGSIHETIQLLSTPEIEARQSQLNDLEREFKSLNSCVAVLGNQKASFELRLRPEQEGLQRAEDDQKQARFDTETSRVELSSRFGSILDTELDQRLAALRGGFPKWDACFEEIARLAREATTTSVAAMNKRNHERSQLADARDQHGNRRHPEYQHDFPVEDESNDAWAVRLRVLNTVELEKSRQLAADRKREWERRLEENVLNELNRRISDAQNTIRILDRYLSQPIGKFRYRLSQRRDMSGFPAIWRLLDSGLEPTDPLTAAIQGGETQRAREELMQAVDAPDQSNDRARRLLDYRNYHRYDIEMIPADHPEAPPISLGRSGKNLSGGENQAPFFISMLAAFRRVYDRGDRLSARSHRLGLVVMDEAFSKLSGDGIEDCLALARSFQFDDARLVSAVERYDAEADARSLAADGWLELKFVSRRPHLIDRAILRLEAEPRWHEAFGFVVPTDDEARRIRDHDWTPEMEFVRDRRLNLAFDELKKLDDFFRHGGRSRILTPIKERSLEIFGDEKRLDALIGGSTLFQKGLTPAMLACFQVAEPLGWQRGPKPSAPILIVENASTWDSYARWNQSSEAFSAIVYGRGKVIVDAISRLSDIFKEIGGIRPVYYFGDIDAAGLQIPQIASRRAVRHFSLPPIFAHLESYRWLLAAKDKAVPYESSQILTEANYAWLDNLADPVREILNAGKRLAQEHIGWELLKNTEIGENCRHRDV